MKLKWLAIPMLVVSLASVSNGSYIQAKAMVAQWLLWDAWEETLSGVEGVKPWPWADSWPVAALNYVPAKQALSNPFTEDKPFSPLIVLNDSSGQGLAFGPSQVGSAIKAGQPGWLMIAGHRDTHFDFLENAKRGELIDLQDTLGNWHRYQLDGFHVVDSRVEGLPQATEINEPGLMLITCYPFDLIDSGGPLRFVAMGRYLGLTTTVLAESNSNLPHIL